MGYFEPNLAQSATFKVPKGYSQLFVVVFGHNMAIKKDFSLPAGHESKINMAHPAIVDKNGDA